MSTEDSFHKIFLSIDQACGLLESSFPFQVDTKEYESKFQDYDDGRGVFNRNHFAPSDLEKLRTTKQRLNVPSHTYSSSALYTDGLMMKSIRNNLRELPGQLIDNPQLNWEDEVLGIMGGKAAHNFESSSHVQSTFVSDGSFNRQKSLPDNIVPYNCFDADYVDVNESYDPLSALIPNSIEDSQQEYEIPELPDAAAGNSVTQESRTTNSAYIKKKIQLRYDLFSRFSRGQDDVCDMSMVATLPDAVGSVHDDKRDKFEREKMKKLQKIERIKSINTLVDATQSLIKGPISHHAKRLRETASFLNRIRFLIQHLQHSRIAMIHKNTKPDLLEMEYKYFHRPRMIGKDRQKNWKISLKHTSNVQSLLAAGTTANTTEKGTSGATALLNQLPFGHEQTHGQGNTSTNTSSATYYLLLEYIEEFPPMMLNYGMVSTIMNYYRSGKTTTTDEDMNMLPSVTAVGQQVNADTAKESSTKIATAMGPSGKSAIALPADTVSSQEVRKYPRIETTTSSTSATSLVSSTSRQVAKASTNNHNTSNNALCTLSNQSASYLSYLPKHVYSLYELSQYYFDASNHSTFVSPLQNQGMFGMNNSVMSTSNGTSLPPVGQTKLLSPDDQSPFLFNFHEHDTVTSFENSLFRCPIFRHEVPTTDFLLIKMKSLTAQQQQQQQQTSQAQAKLGLTNEHGTFVYHLKEIQYLYLAGQMEPQKVVPIPTSTVQNRFAFSKTQEKFILVALLRLLQQHHQTGLTMDEIFKYILKYHLYKEHATAAGGGGGGSMNATAGYNYYLQQKAKAYKYYIEEMVRRYAESDTKQYNAYDGTAGYKPHWRLKDENEYMVEQEIRSFTPEDVCVHESSLAYEYKLQHIHHIYFTGYANMDTNITGGNTGSGSSTAMTAHHQNTIQGSMDLLLKIQYYLLLTYAKKRYYLDVVYTNLLQHLRKKQLVSVQGKNVVLHKMSHQPTLKMKQYGDAEGGPQVPYYYQHPLLYYYHKKIQQLNNHLDVIRYILHHVLIAPWNTTYTFVKSHVEKDTSKYGTGSNAVVVAGAAGNAANFMQLNDSRGDPSGMSEGYSFVRLPYYTFTQLQSILFPLQSTSNNITMTAAQKKEENKIVGTSRDLRKLFKNDAINLLVALGVKKDEATKLKRWDRIHIIREMVNGLERKGLMTADLRRYVRDPVLVQRVMAEEKQATDGGKQPGNRFFVTKSTGWEKEVFGSIQKAAISSEEEYQLCCQEIWVRERAALSMTTHNAIAPGKGYATAAASSSSSASMMSDGESMDTDMITGEMIDEWKKKDDHENHPIAPGKDGHIPVRTTVMSEDEDEEEEDDDFESIQRELVAKKEMTSLAATHSASNTQQQQQQRAALLEQQQEQEELQSFFTGSTTGSGVPITPGTNKSSTAPHRKFTFGTAAKANATAVLSETKTGLTSSSTTSSSSSSTSHPAIQSSLTTTGPTSSLTTTHSLSTALTSTSHPMIPTTSDTTATPSSTSSMIPWHRPRKAVRRLTVITQPDGSEITKIEFFWQAEEIDRVETNQVDDRKERMNMRNLLPTRANQIKFAPGGSGGPGMPGGGTGRGRGRGRKPYATSTTSNTSSSSNYRGDSMWQLEDDMEDMSYPTDGLMTVKVEKIKKAALHHHHTTSSATNSAAAASSTNLSIRKSSAMSSSHLLPEDEEEMYMQKKHKSSKRSATTMMNLRLPRVSLAVRLEKELMTVWNTKNAEIFHHPVDATRYVDYYTRIDQPICLSQIREKIVSYQYTTVSSFLADLDLMVSNSRRFNGQANQVTLIGEKLVDSCKVNLIHERTYLGQEHDLLTKLEDTIMQKELFYGKTRSKYHRLTGQPLSMLPQQQQLQQQQQATVQSTSLGTIAPSFGMFSSNA